MSDVTEQDIIYASQLGTEAFANGIKAAPVLDKRFMDFTKSLAANVKTVLPLLDAWNKAWHKANIDAPVPGLNESTFKGFLNNLKFKNNCLIESIEEAFDILFESDNKRVQLLSMASDGHVVISIDGNRYDYLVDYAVVRSRYKEFRYKPFKFVNWLDEHYMYIKPPWSEEWLNKQEHSEKSKERRQVA